MLATLVRHASSLLLLVLPAASLAAPPAVTLPGEVESQGLAGPLAEGGPARPAAPAPGPFYVGIEPGLALFNSSGVTAAGQPGKVTFQWGPGFTLAAVAGYRLGESFRFETELGYRRADASRIAGEAASGTSLSTVSLLANAYYHITQVRAWGLGLGTPFVGVGLGAMIGYVKAPGESANDTAFGYQLTLGGEQALTPHLLFHLAYRYQGSSGFDVSFEGAPATLSFPYASHNFGAGLDYRF